MSELRLEVRQYTQDRHDYFPLVTSLKKVDQLQKIPCKVFLFKSAIHKNNPFWMNKGLLLNAENAKAVIFVKARIHEQ